MIVEKYDEKEFFDKSIKMLEKDYGNNFANDFKDLYIKQQEEIKRLNEELDEYSQKWCKLMKAYSQKENIIKEVRELAIIKKARVESEPDYSKSYLEGYENAIQTQHLSHSGVMLETIKSTIKTTCNDFLEILDKGE